MQNRNVDRTNESLNYYLERMQPIEEFAKKQTIHFACKALNFRVNKNKWDGNRPLAVYVNWALDADNKLNGELIFSRPLSTKGDVIGENIRNILSKLNIGKDNFTELKNHLHEDLKFI